MKKSSLSLTCFVLAALPAASWAASAPRRAGPSLSTTSLFKPVSASRARALVGRLRTLAPTAATRPLIDELSTVDAESAPSRYRLAPLALFLQDQDLGAVSDEALNHSLSDAREALDAASSWLITHSRRRTLGLAEAGKMQARFNEIRAFFPTYLRDRTLMKLRASEARLSARAAAMRARQSRRKVATLAAETLETHGLAIAADASTGPEESLANDPARQGLVGGGQEGAGRGALLKRSAPAETAPDSKLLTRTELPAPIAMETAAGRTSERLISLDAFRGLTVAGMIMVNAPGNEQAYAQLRHAAWHGWHLADLVFPSFLVIMGVSASISLAKRLARGDAPAEMSLQILRRTGLMFLLGLLASVFLYLPDTAAGFQVGGVLQRIALCYLCSSLIFLRAAPVTQAASALAMLAGYWLVMTFVPVPGYGPGALVPEGNLVHYVDRLLLRGPFHTREPLFEGLLSTIPAVATSLMGVLAGQWLLSARAAARKAAGLLAAGLAAAAAGLAWSAWFPINKPIWTSSFALFSGGAALASLASFYWLVEVRRFKFWTKPFEIFGSNPLLAYFLSGILYEAQKLTTIPHWLGFHGHFRMWVCHVLFNSRLSPPDASLAYSLSYALLCLGAMAVLYRKKLFLRL